MQSICAVDECDRAVKARGWCLMHYKRWSKNGDPTIRRSSAPKPRCAVDSCSNISRTLGLCHAHYWRLRKIGDVQASRPLAVQRRGMTPYEKVMKMSAPTESGCREFLGAKNGNGYGHLGYMGKTLYAHRVVLAHHEGDSELLVLHSCDNPACVEVTHLRYGTAQENSQDALSRGRHFSPFRKSA